MSLDVTTIIGLAIAGLALFFGKAAVIAGLKYGLNLLGYDIVPKDSVQLAQAPVMAEAFESVNTLVDYFESKGCKAGCAKARELGAHLFSDPKAQA
jgi:hypothetical protein